MKKILISLILIALRFNAFAENLEVENTDITAEAAAKKDKEKKDVKYNEDGEIIKTGINLGPLPVVAFDADRGFQYGALLNIYNFGDGKNYPNPNSTWYIEASAFTGGTWNIFLNYDNKEIFKNARLSVCTKYSNERALDFYGFNGYQSNYVFADDNFFENNPDFITYDDTKKGVKLENKFINKGKYPKGFYRYSRQSFVGKADLIGNITENLKWEVGYSFYWVNNQEFTPKGYTVKDGSLYSLYKAWGIIDPNEKANQTFSAIKAGILYDTRNVENNPTKGIWAEAHAIVGPKWLGSSQEAYKISATWRQYIPIVNDKLVLAYRIAYQGFLGKDTPWYLMPYYSNMGDKRDFDAIGGYRTVRGIMLDRVQGIHTGFYNVELRYRFIDFKMLNQNIAFALTAFSDGATVFKGYDMTNKNEASLAMTPEGQELNKLYNTYVLDRKDGLHGSAGAGLRFIMNQNFIVAFEYARCFNKQDGKDAFYINTGFLF